MADVQIADVAKLAQVSVSTVSNVLNGRINRMRPETLQRVNDAIKTLGYQPNVVARSLKTGRAPMLGLLVPSIASPFFALLASEMERVALAHGYRMLLGNTHRDVQKETDLLEDFFAYGIRGVVTGSSLPTEDHYRPLVDRGLVLVSFDRRGAPGSTLPVDYVSIDNFHAGYGATRHLIEHGHREIAFVTAPAGTVSRIERRRGYEAAMAESGLSLDVIQLSLQTLYADGELAEVGRQMGREIAKRSHRPTGIVAMSDMIAIGMLAGLHDNHVVVPRDISLVGIDDLFLDALISPTITSMRQPLPEMAEAMVTRLVERLGDSTLTGTERVFRPELVKRNSVRALTKAG
ncbi:MAG TPA: LacI family DNA-binding transcriptional regulator [Polyangiaceae bacterium]|nr:LacI family DNA-binding transcriptional regulator [Polyangiaceae bacterium]